MNPRVWLPLAAAALLGGLILVVALRPALPSPATGPVIPQERYIPPDPVTPALPPLPFSEVSPQDSGLAFRHQSGAHTRNGAPSRFLPECMGPGVVLFDADTDGDLDLFVPSGTDFTGSSTEARDARSALFLNDGALRFHPAPPSAGLTLICQGMGGAAADIDGDGDQDLLVTSWGGARLFRNESSRAIPRFTDVTDSAGLANSGWTDAAGHRGPDWSTSAAFFDADNDGDLDLFLANYVKWTPETDVFATIDGRRKSFTNPERYHGNSCRFLLGDGRGHFEDNTRAAGVFNEEGKSLGVALCDVDDDGRLDVVVANDTQPNFLYRNLGGGRFKECGLDAGIAYDENARTRAGMGIAVADTRNDGVPVIAIGNFANEPVALYRMEAPLFFRDVTQQEGVAAVTTRMLTFGVLFADLDSDGMQDLLLANGHIEPHIQDVQGSISYEQPLQALRNCGGGRFEDWKRFAGAPFSTPMVARGLAAADLDADGDLDLVAATNGGPLRLLRNDSTDSQRAMRIQLSGRAPNTNAIGARVTLITRNGRQQRLVHTGSSYLSQSELVLHFGLAAGDEALKLDIRWPDGTIETRAGPFDRGTLLRILQQPR